MKLYEADSVGLVITEDYFLLDIDHRKLSDYFVQMMLEKFDTYTEYSPNGNDIHILGKLAKDKLPIYYDENSPDAASAVPIITKIQNPTLKSILAVPQQDFLPLQAMR